jgi:Domain of unknown function (DUF6431)
MAMVWAWASSVEAYAACGKSVVVPRAVCRSCQAPMGFWSGYWRQLRVDGNTGWRIWVRRGRCSSCRVTHVLLPSFCLVGRSFGVEVIGSAVEAAAGGRGTGWVARAAGVAQSTARSWCRRHRERAGVARAVMDLSGVDGLAGVAGEARGLGRWPVMSLVTGGRWLVPVDASGSTTSRVFPDGGERRLMVGIDPDDGTRPP